eukprot:5444197-Amphidinium_carterae.2
MAFLEDSCHPKNLAFSSLSNTQLTSPCTLGRVSTVVMTQAEKSFNRQIKTWASKSEQVMNMTTHARVHPQHHNEELQSGEVAKALHIQLSFYSGDLEKFEAVLRKEIAANQAEHGLHSGPDVDVRGAAGWQDCHRP